MLNAVSYALNASCVALFLKDFDVIYAYQLTPITQVIPAVLNKKLYKKKLFLYCCDLAPASGKKLQNKGVISKIYAWLCRKIYAQCDRIGVTSESFIDYLEAINHYPREKIIYLPQHANDDMLNIDMSAPDNGIVDFLFAGNISMTQGLDTIVNAVAILRDCRNTNDFLVHIVGDGSAVASLKNTVSEQHLESFFRFHGWQKRERMPYFFKNADVLLITLNNDSSVGNTIPAKLQTYMTVGKPILGAISGCANKIITESGCGLCAEAGDSQALASNMLAYMENPQHFSACGAKAISYYCEHYTLEKHMEVLIKELEHLADWRLL